MASSGDRHSLHKLELEVHYLSQALSKLHRASPEHACLARHLYAAQEELDARRQDDDHLRAHPPPPPTGSPDSGIGSRRSPPYVGGIGRPYRDNPDDDDHEPSSHGISRPYRDDPDDRGGDNNIVWDGLADVGFGEDEGNDGGGYGDGSNEEEDGSSSSEEEGEECEEEGSSGRTFLYHSAPLPSRLDGGGGGASGDRGMHDGRANYSLPRGGWTNARRGRLFAAALALVAIVLVSCTLLLVPSSGSGKGSSAEADGTPFPGGGGQGQAAAAVTEPCASFSLHLVPDAFGNETSWQVVRYRGGEGGGSTAEGKESPTGVVLEGGPYSYKKFDGGAGGGGGGGSHYEMVHATGCLPVGSYAFVLRDEGGDGICCSFGRGEYGINLSRGRVVRPLSLGKFVGREEVTPFRVGEDDIDVLPAKRPEPAPPTSDGALAGGRLPSGAAASSGEQPEGPCASFSLHLIPDQYGNETSWKVIKFDGVGSASVRESLDPQKGTTVLEGGPYMYRKEFDHEATGSHYQMVHAETCLSVGAYSFVLYDAKGDGICCSYGRGEYGITLKGRVIRPLSLGKFIGAGQVTPFQVTTDDIDVLPAPSSSSSSTTAEVEAAANDIAPGAGPSTPSSPSYAESANQPCASFSLQLVPDRFGNETKWEVVRTDVLDGDDDEEEDDEVDDGTYYPTTSPIHDGRRYLREATREAQEGSGQAGVVLSGGPYSYQADSGNSAVGSHFNAIIAETCLVPGSYSFVLHDAAEDGICCGSKGRGEYGINLSKGRVIRPFSQGKFVGSQEITAFQVTDDDIDVLGTSSDSSSDPFGFLPESNPISSINSFTSLVTMPENDVATGRGKSFGMLFDVEANHGASKVVISGIDMLLEHTNPTHYEIWTKEGSWQDPKQVKSDYLEGYSRIAHGTITGRGPSDFAKIALRDFKDVEIRGGSVQAFYVTLNDDNLVFQRFDGQEATQHEMKRMVQASSDELNVFYGAAVRTYPLGRADPVTDFWFDAGFLGRFWYRESGSD